MRENIRRALLEFGPCSVRDLYEYLRSDIAVKRGLCYPKDLTIEGIRREMEGLTEENGMFVKFTCSTGTKIRYGITQIPDYSRTEPRYLVPSGTVHTCIHCALRIFECDGNVLHFPGNCINNHPQDHFKILQFNDMDVIISDNFVYGIIERKTPYTLRLTKEFRHDITNKMCSELWYINQKARLKNRVPKDRLLPLKALETIL